jgi:hypothetical protein
VVIVGVVLMMVFAAWIVKAVKRRWSSTEAPAWR